MDAIVYQIWETSQNLFKNKNQKKKKLQTPWMNISL